MQSLFGGVRLLVFTWNNEGEAPLPTHAVFFTFFQGYSQLSLKRADLIPCKPCVNLTTRHYCTRKSNSDGSVSDIQAAIIMPFKHL